MPESAQTWVKSGAGAMLLGGSAMPVFDWSGGTARSGCSVPAAVAASASRHV